VLWSTGTAQTAKYCPDPQSFESCFGDKGISTAEIKRFTLIINYLYKVEHVQRRYTAKIKVNITQQNVDSLDDVLLSHRLFCDVANTSFY